MTTPKLSLSRMEEYCAKASRHPWFCFDLDSADADFVANARDDFPALLSWAKRARASLLFVEENCVNANEHCEECEEIEQLLSEFGE